MSAVPISPERPSAREGEPKGLTFEHRPSLDGIRAIAALLVVLFHAGMPFFEHGYVGVDVFFVLSGFLITSLLARELHNSGKLSFVAFYARRARRLLPAALGVLIVTAIAYEIVASPVAVAENRGGFVAAALYFSNWYFLSQSRDYFAEEAHPSPVQHYWSLSVEEQFYLLWPALVLGLVLLARRYRFRLDLTTVALAIAGMAYAGLLAAQDPMASYFGTPARAYQLLIGAAIAFLCLRWESDSAERTGSGKLAGALLATTGLGLVIFSGTPGLVTGSAYWHGIVSALGAGALILGLEMAPRSVAGISLAWTPARLVGKWSYAVYLWHWPVIIVGDELGLLPEDSVPRTAIVVAVTLVLSAATFYAVERPTQRINLRSPTRRRIVAVSGLATAGVTAFACAAVLRIDPAAQDIVREATARPGPVQSILKKAGSRKATVLLVGDSHAVSLYPALSDLARAQGWSLVPVARNGCPWPSVLSINDHGFRIRHCDEFRTAAIRAARRNKADLALLVSHSVVARPLDIRGNEVKPGGPGWLKEVARGTEDFLAELHPLVKHVVIVEPIAETEEAMVDCLAEGGDPGACSAPAIDLPGTLPLEALWRERSDVTTVSLDELICPRGVCPAMVGGVVTHRDRDHLTENYAHLIARKLDRWLRAWGIVLARGEVRAPA